MSSVTRVRACYGGPDRTSPGAEEWIRARNIGVIPRPVDARGPSRRLRSRRGLLRRWSARAFRRLPGLPARSGARRDRVRAVGPVPAVLVAAVGDRLARGARAPDAVVVRRRGVRAGVAGPAARRRVHVRARGARRPPADGAASRGGRAHRVQLGHLHLGRPARARGGDRARLLHRADRVRADRRAAARRAAAGGAVDRGRARRGGGRGARGRLRAGAVGGAGARVQLLLLRPGEEARRRRRDRVGRRRGGHHARPGARLRASSRRPARARSSRWASGTPCC